ncbi:hypothetical protein HPP92_022042 [Vanilla planifolia]|uniref:Uncharacterized protein n=1 Tax=Vanilla planifolia TaxID=51239 RepID=A0A835PPK2_VANPL|nr:hypothetical protein HPP92_022376 [Vanilla planifolia]KAG0458914.1 hypothetical protein HPP92_022042 [Vanilla planifolia]
MYTREMRALACREKVPSLHMVEQNVHKEVIQVTAHQRTQQKSKEPAVVKTTENFLQITAVNKPKQKPSWMVVPMEDKPAQSQAELSHPSTSCFGDWKKTLFPCFLARTFGGLRVDKDKDKKRRRKKKATVSIRDKMNAVMMSSRMKKERIGVMAKVLSAFGKHR